MRTTSNRELARQIGVSETAVRRAEKSGRIRVVPRRMAPGIWSGSKRRGPATLIGPSSGGIMRRPGRCPRPRSVLCARRYPPGTCHFPQYEEEFFRQLTAERLVTRMVKGFPRGSWEKEPGRRNEALDCRVYARAAAAIYGLDRFEERHWRRMEEALARSVERNDEPVPSARPSARPAARQVIESGYMAR